MTQKVAHLNPNLFLEVPAFVWALLSMKPPIKGIAIVIVVIVIRKGRGVAVTITRMCIYKVLFRFYRVKTSVTRWTGTCRCCCGCRRCCSCGCRLSTIWHVWWLSSQYRMSIFIGRRTRTFLLQLIFNTILKLCYIFICYLQIEFLNWKF